MTRATGGRQQAYLESFDWAQEERKKTEMPEKNPCVLSSSKHSGFFFQQAVRDSRRRRGAEAKKDR
jgi:hypothetical protein